MEQEQWIISTISNKIKNNKIITWALTATLLALWTMLYEYRDWVRVTQVRSDSFERTEIIWRWWNPLKRTTQTSRIEGDNLDEESIRESTIAYRNQKQEKEQKNNKLNPAGL
jgi:hypothetical protein